MGISLHSGPINGKLQAAKIRHTVRVHLIQLLLQIVDLLLDGLLPVKLLIVLLLGIFRLGVDPVHLHILVGDLLRQLHAFPVGVGCQELIALLSPLHNPGAHHGDGLIHTIDLRQIGADSALPGLAGRGANHLLLELHQMFLLQLRIKIIDRFPPTDPQFNAVIAVDGHLVQIAALAGVDHQKTVLRAVLNHLSGHPDRVEGILRKLVPGLSLPQGDHHHPLPDLRRFAGHILIGLGAQVHVGIRHQDDIIYWNNCHSILLSLTDPVLRYVR